LCASILYIIWLLMLICHRSVEKWQVANLGIDIAPNHLKHMSLDHGFICPWSCDHLSHKLQIWIKNRPTVLLCQL
jgi:hypothetical protein